MRLSRKNSKILILTSIMGVSAYLGGTNVHAAVIKGGSDITPVDVHGDEAGGVAMTYTTYGNNQVASGSGVFVAPNIMLTVAHNYLDKDKANGTSFVRGGNGAISYVVMNSDSAKRGNNTSSGYDDIIPKGNIHYYNDKEFVTSYSGDLAAVVTEKPVEAMTNGEDHARDLGVAKQGDKITFMGYPNDFSSKRLSEESKAKLVNGKMYKVSGTLSTLDTITGSGTYNTSALGGFSGGPIFNEKGELVGIHQHGTNTDFGDDSSQHGGGLFFTDKHRKWINTMIAEHGIKGWFVNGNDKYYYDDNHKSLVNTERDINGAKYRFDSNGRATLISGKETGEVVIKGVNKSGEVLFERVVGSGAVGEGFTYNFKTDNLTKEYFKDNPNATIVSIDGENINKKFNDSWSKDYASKFSLGKTVIKMVVDGGNKFNRTISGKVDTGKPGVPTLVPDEKIKGVPNGEKNFYSTVALTSPAGLGSGTLINDDTIVTVAHNFVHLNTKNNPITVDNNVGGSTVYLATLPNGKQVRFGNEDIKFWNREGFINGFKNDLAVVKLKNKFTGETGAKLHEDVSNLKQGGTIHVFGYPKGKMNPIINGKVETVENYGANIMGVGYQGSAPGMSGGGMFNDKGELIGVHQNGVEGFRAGGITFSKEQLDWIKSVVNGNEIKPVYLKDEVRNDDKKDDKKEDKKDDDSDRLEKEKQEAERLSRERLEKERLEKERLEKLEKEKQERERLEKERLEKERLEKERLEKERLEKAENERLAKEKLEKEKLEREKSEKERLEKERLEKLAVEKAENERLARERLEKERLEKERLEKLEKEKHERERLEKERLEKERLEKLAAEKVENERLAREKLEKERVEKGRLEKLAAEKAESERLAREKLEKERLEKERLEKLAAEKAENERLAREKLEKERLEKERLEKLAVEKAENERLAREKLEKERLEKERLEKLAAEKAENERLAREKLEKERLEKERLEKLAAEKENAEKLAREKEMQAKKEKEEAENLARLKAETEKKAKDKEEQERLKRERLELEKFAREKAEKERLARENAEKLAREKEEAEKLAREKQEAEKVAREKLEKERLVKEQAEKLAREKADAERLAREKLERERLTKEQAEKLAREKVDAERLAREKLEKERLAKEQAEKLLREKQEAERLAKEKLEREKVELEKLKREEARLLKEQAELELAKKAQKEREEAERLNAEKLRLEKEKLRLEVEELNKFEKDRLEKERIRLEEEKARLEKLGSETIKTDKGTPLINEIPEYSGVLAGNGLDGEGNIIKSLVNEVPEYKLEDIPKNESKDKESSDKNTIKNETKESTNKTPVKNSNEVKKELENFDNKNSVEEKVASINSKTTDKSILKPNSNKLPETGSESYAALATFAIGVGSILGLRRRKKEDKE